MARNQEILVKLEYIKDVLYFAITRPGKIPKSSPKIHYFCIDDDLVYENYYSDFGPLNLACIYRYCKILKSKLDELLNRQLIVHCTSCDPKKKTNSAFLLGCYGILYLSLSPREAFKPLMSQSQYYRAFRDASQGDPIYTISIFDCLMAVKRARELNFFNFADFDYDEFVRLDRIRGGDRNWIVPGKFLAFTGPVEDSQATHYSPLKYIEYFKMNNVKAVVQLNEKHYDESIFTSAGIAHYSLYFPDGSCPSRNIVFKFLQVSEDTKGALAVHCKAGLGRTGTLIGCYIIKHYRMTAHETIAWMRICRPGSVIGHQQGWLEKSERWLWRLNSLKKNQSNTIIQPTHRYGIYSVAEKSARIQEDVMGRIVSPNLRTRLLSEMSAKRMSNLESRNSSPKDSSPNSGREGQQRILSQYVPKINLMLRQQSKGDNNESFANSSWRSNSNIGHKPCIAHRESRLKSVVRDEGTMTQTERMGNKYDKFSIDSHKFGFHPMPVYNVKQNLPPKVVNDVAKISIKAILGEDRRKPQGSPTAAGYYPKDKNIPKPDSPTYVYNNLSRLYATRNTQPPRRLLGRSPSPPSRLGELTRATNTTRPSTPSSSRRLISSSSLLMLRAALASPKTPKPFDVFGASSVGAASLGARDPPPRLRLPSVRSDDRPTATQGDLLNRIKVAWPLVDITNYIISIPDHNPRTSFACTRGMLTRRIKESLQSEKCHNLKYTERLVVPLENPDSRKILPRTSVLVTSNTQDRPITQAHARPFSPRRHAHKLNMK